MNYEDFKNPEFQEKLRSAKDPQELLALAKEAGYELSDEELNSIAGGNLWDEIWECLKKTTCPDVGCGELAS